MLTTGFEQDSEIAEDFLKELKLDENKGVRDWVAAHCCSR